MIKAILLSLSLLVGCATQDAILPPKERVVNIAPEILTLCDLLPLIKQSPSNEEVLSHTLNIIELYAVCAAKQKDSVIIIKEFANK